MIELFCSFLCMCVMYCLIVFVVGLLLKLNNWFSSFFFEKMCCGWFVRILSSVNFWCDSDSGWLLSFVRWLLWLIMRLLSVSMLFVWLLL